MNIAVSKGAEPELSFENTLNIWLQKDSSHRMELNGLFTFVRKEENYRMRYR